MPAANALNLPTSFPPACCPGDYRGDRKEVAGTTPAGQPFVMFATHAADREDDDRSRGIVFGDVEISESSSNGRDFASDTRVVWHRTREMGVRMSDGRGRDGTNDAFGVKKGSLDEARALIAGLAQENNMAPAEFVAALPGALSFARVFA